MNTARYSKITSAANSVQQLCTQTAATVKQINALLSEARDPALDYSVCKDEQDELQSANDLCIAAIESLIGAYQSLQSASVSSFTS